MDAVGELHDQIRNFPGAFENLQKTLSGLQTIRKNNPNLVLGIKTTVVPLNAHALYEIAAYAVESRLFTIISPRIITANRFGNSDLEADLMFSPEELETIITFYESPHFAWSGHREALLGYLMTGSIQKPCSAGFNTLFIRHTGEVYCCPVIPTALGNITEQSLGTIFRSPAADQFRKKTGAFSECNVCTEPGLERIAWPLEGFSLLKMMDRIGRGNFNRLIEHMGIGKYL
jgi:MoaA/NifB/PqqE/SkfB family radical SAM enzyme